MNNASNFNILHRNDIGYIARCACCDDIQIELGNVVTHMDLESFGHFHAGLRRIAGNPDLAIAEAPGGEKIMLRTPLQNFYLAFSLSEFASVIDLFGQAAVMLEINEIVSG